MRLDLVVQHGRLAAVLVESDLGAALGEPGHAAGALAGDRVAFRRVEVDNVTLPLKVAFTGPTLATTLAVNSVSETFSMVWQPGIACFRISGSLSPCQTRSRGAGMRNSPVISIGMFLSCVV